MSVEKTELLRFATGFFKHRPPFEDFDPGTQLQSATLTGLRMVAQDCVDSAEGWSQSEVADMDAFLIAVGAQSLSTMRARYSRKLTGVLRTGQIRSEEDYYLLRNFLAEADPEDARAAKVRDLLDAYEARGALRRADIEHRSPR